MSTESKVIVVFAATGQIGSALVQTLAAQNESEIKYKLLALSRNANSGGAKRLSTLPGVEVITVEPDVMDIPIKVFKKLEDDGVVSKGGIYGVFSNQGYVSDEVMVKQGKAIADASVEWGVKHIVYLSIDNGGLEDTKVAGFEAKRQVENYINTLPIGHTYLRASQFMDNLLPTSDFMFKLSRTILLRHTFKSHPERKHQLISTRDIGKAGAKAFMEGPDWSNGVFRLAGWEGTVDEIQKIYEEVIGEPIAETYSIIASIVRSWIPVMRDMSDFYDQHGFNIDINQVKKDLPEVEDLRMYLERNKSKVKR